MSRPSDPQATALLDHIFTQTLSNIEFLASHNYISSVDASQLSSRLLAAQSLGDAGADTSLANSMHALAVAPVPPVGRRAVPPPSQPRLKQARALWAYNEEGREPNDLSFSSGETVEIVDETNADWWTGKCRGRQGLFPSNHVEILNDDVSSPPPPAFSPASSPVYSPAGPPMMPPQPMNPAPPLQYNPGYTDPKPVYRPFGAAYQQQDQPPPAQVQQVNSVGLQQAPEQEKKKSKFGRLGNTMANSAAGGVGFGAGAAIGSGIVNAIF